MPTVLFAGAPVLFVMFIQDNQKCNNHESGFVMLLLLLLGLDRSLSPLNSSTSCVNYPSSVLINVSTCEFIPVLLLLLLLLSAQTYKFFIFYYSRFFFICLPSVFFFLVFSPITLIYTRMIFVCTSVLLYLWANNNVSFVVCVCLFT